MAGNTTCPHAAAGQVILTDRQTSCAMCGALLQKGGASPDGISAAYPGDLLSAQVAALDATLGLPDLPL